LPESVEALTISANAEHLAVLSPGSIRWDTWTNFVAGKVKPDVEKPPRAIALSPDGSVLLVATLDGKVQAWTRGPAVVKNELFSFPVTKIVWHPKGKAALLGCSDGRAILASFDGKWNVAHDWKHRSAVTGVAWGREGELAAVACADGFVYIRQAGDGQVLSAFPAHPTGPVALAAGRNGQFISGGVDRAAKLW